ncbi:MAG: peptidylprolyl isomerase [Alphaproteobacteria bacterium]|nr:peptidylprolyl isomerase [Alphaproteobacteria bacterium]
MQQLYTSAKPWIISMIMLIVSTVASAATSIEVIATVDGVPITSHDLNERRNMLIKTTGIQITSDNQAQIDRDVLQMLIDDQIKIATGEQFLGSQMQAVEDNADILVNQTFSQNGENPDAVLQELNIPRDVIKRKFKADILWASIINGRFDGQFSNARSEAEKERQQLEQNIAEPHINLDEIVLLPEPGRNYAATINLANQMVKAIRQGADFGRIAQQYSVSGSANIGGNIGWVLVKTLDPELADIIMPMQPGDITDPIDRDGAILIYRLSGKRQNGLADPMETRISITRLLYPLATTDDADRLEAAAKIKRETADISTCSDLQALHQSYGSGMPFDLGILPLYSLAPELRDLVAPLDTGMISEVVSYKEGMAAFMICEKQAPKLDLPDLDSLELNVKNRYFSVLSARYLNQLRRRAVIDIRISF